MYCEKCYAKKLKIELNFVGDASSPHWIPACKIQHMIHDD